MEFKKYVLIIVNVDGKLVDEIGDCFMYKSELIGIVGF